jgi:RES domain
MFDLARKGAALAIGALPSLADGSEPRPLTQEWARAIYEDHPAGPETTGVRYRSAYNFGHSLALWDCDDGVEIVRDARGRLQDMALNDSRVLLRLQVQMRRRLINVTMVSSDDCGECKKAT